MLVEVHEELHATSLLFVSSIDRSIHVAEALERARHHGLYLLIALRALDCHIYDVNDLLLYGSVVVLVKANEYLAHALQKIGQVHK